MNIPVARFEQGSSKIEITESDVTISPRTNPKQPTEPVSLDHSWYYDYLKMLQKERNVLEPEMLKHIEKGEFVPMFGEGQVITLTMECKDPYISQMLFKALQNHEFIAGCIIHKIYLSDLENRLESLKTRIKDAIKLDKI